MLAGILTRLPEAQRAVLELAYFYGLTQSEIVARYSATPCVATNTVRSLKGFTFAMCPLQITNGCGCQFARSMTQPPERKTAATSVPRPCWASHATHWWQRLGSA